MECFSNPSPKLGPVLAATRLTPGTSIKKYIQGNPRKGKKGKKLSLSDNPWATPAREGQRTVLYSTGQSIRVL
jgi:hypothetical protein